jgi:hypothetical protein
MPQSDKIEPTSNGFSVHVALEHLSSSSPHPPASSAVATAATRCRHDGPLAQLNLWESETLAPRSLPSRQPVGKRRGGQDNLMLEAPSEPPLTGEAAEPHG